LQQKATKVNSSVTSEYHKVMKAHQPVPKEREQRTCRAIGNLENQQSKILTIAGG
jgi:hypothetical protein